MKNCISNLYSWLGVVCLVVVLVPDQLKADQHMNVAGEGRVRWENRNQADFNTAADDRVNEIGSRFRLGFDFTAEKAKVFIQPSFSKTWGSGTASSGGTVAANLDLYQAYIQYAMTDMVDITVGREALNYGDGIVIGNFDWSPTARAFDDLRFRIKYGPGWTDVFYAKIGDTFTAAANYRDLFGVYNSWGFGDAFKNVDLYVLLDTSGSNQQHTNVGGRLKSDMNDMDYRVESTVQLQKNADTEFLVDGEFGYTVVPAQKTRLGVGYFYGSKAYAATYTDVHKWMGAADIFGRTNLNGFRANIGSSLTDTISASLEWHMFSRTDSAVSAGYGIADTDKAVANEFDLAINCHPTSAFNTTFGASFVMPGTHVKNTVTPNDATMTFFYIQMGLKV